jgi:hypothetical protein
MSNTQRIFVTEVHNFGGFFGGDTVTLSAVPWPAGEETTLTIDEKAFENVQDRHTIAAEMVIDLDMAGERVDRARVLGGRDWDLLKQTFGDTQPSVLLDAPQIRAYHCSTCDLWLLGQPFSEGERLTCSLCDQPLA